MSEPTKVKERAGDEIMSQGEHSIGVTVASWEALKAERDRLRERVAELEEALASLASGMERVAEALPEYIQLMPGMKWMPEQARALLAKERP